MPRPGPQLVLDRVLPRARLSMTMIVPQAFVERLLGAGSTVC